MMRMLLVVIIRMLITMAIIFMLEMMDIWLML